MRLLQAICAISAVAAFEPPKHAFRGLKQTSIDAFDREPAPAKHAFPGLQAPNTLNINIIALGGDPTGATDSYPAFMAAIDAALNISTSSKAADVGAGGVTIDLAGGTYSLSRTVYMSGWQYRQFTIANGAVVAGPGFNSSGYLFDVGPGVQQLTFTNLVLDSNYTGGGLRFDATLQMTVFNVFFLHYTTHGILGDDTGNGQGHELMVSNCFFAERMWGEPGFNVTAQQTGVAIEMRFPDSNFYNSIIRCTKAGVINKSGANLFHGLHIYASCNKDPSGANVAVAMVLASNGNRVSNCYFDDSPLVLTYLWGTTTITDNMFYGLAGAIFAPTQADTAVTGLFFKNNYFDATNYATPYMVYDVGNGTVNQLALSGVVVADNSFADATFLRTTRVQTSVALTATNGQVTACAPADTSSLLFGDPAAQAARNSALMPPAFNWRAELAGIDYAPAPPASAGRVTADGPADAAASGVAFPRFTATAMLTGYTSAMPIVLTGYIDGSNASSLQLCATAIASPGGASWNATVAATLDQSRP